MESFYHLHRIYEIQKDFSFPEKTYYNASMFEKLLQDLDLTPNEARIYETLLKNGASTVPDISHASGIHRRNIHDALHRLIDKGYVMEVVRYKDNLYEAVNPEIFRAHLQEKTETLDGVLPHMLDLFSKQSRAQEELFIYRWPEWWKNYLQDIIRTREDFYCIGGKGGWLDQRLKNFFPQFQKQMGKNDIKMWHLFDDSVRIKCPEITKIVWPNYRFLPPEADSQCSVDIFGDRVNITSNLNPGWFEEDFSFTVIVNAQIAEAFRSWFQVMWKQSKK
jgi:predicted transcriptional regulator